MLGDGPTDLVNLLAQDTLGKIGCQMTGNMEAATRELVLKTGNVRGIRFNTLDAICKTLECKPGDILDYEPDPGDAEATER